MTRNDPIIQITERAAGSQKCVTVDARMGQEGLSIRMLQSVSCFLSPHLAIPYRKADVDYTTIALVPYFQMLLKKNVYKTKMLER